MRKPLHPTVVDSDLMFGISVLTGLSWDEMSDPEVIWFLCRGMRPIPRPFDDVIEWRCQGSCQWFSPRGKGGSKGLKEAVRQHLRDKHGLVQPSLRGVIK